MRLILKSTIRKIKKSFGRFLSVLLIVSLGIGFFAGLRETFPTMINTIEKYYDNHYYSDVKIVSSLGLTENDVESLKKLNYIDKVIPSYSSDVLIDGYSIRIHALESEINLVKIIKGKYPKNINECLADATVFKLNQNLTFLGSETKYLNTSSCKVVGLVDSVSYLRKEEKGVSKVGNGKLEGYLYINKEAFNYDVYTEIYLTAKDTILENAYTNKYDQKFNLLYEELLTLKPIREAIRYEEILSEATDKINDIQSEVNNKISKEEKKLIDDAKITLSNQEINLEDELSNNLKIINDNKNEVKNNLKILNDTIKGLDLTPEKLDEQINNFSTILNNLDPNDQDYINKKTELETNINELSTLKTNYDLLNNNLNKLNEEEIKLNNKINEAKILLSEENNKLLDNEKELNTAYTKYNEGISKLNTEKNNAKKKINEAKEELKEVEEPVWYLLDRNDNLGYNEFYNDASTVEKISGLFPLFFILIVALMTLNTISRMIEEERTEIGIYKALGYSNKRIMSGYLFYVLFATSIGLILGLSIGYSIIPRVVYNIFGTNYIVPKLEVDINILSLIIMLIISYSLIISITIYGTTKELKIITAELLRPKAPKKGKKVFIEKYTIWKKFSFTWKVTIRNIFRYKKRIIMTVVGIAGSTALLLAGFGIKDSIEEISNLQFKDTIKYQGTVMLNKEITALSYDLNKTLHNNSINEKMLIKQEGFTFKTDDSKNYQVTLIVPETNEINKYISLKDINNKKELIIPEYGVYITKRMAELLNIKINDNLKIRNNINKLFIVQVKGIVDNYLLNYIYMSENYYELIFDEMVKYNSLLIKIDDDNYQDLSTNLLKNKEITAINYTEDNIKFFQSIISGLNKIVFIIILAAAFLALIILYNLTSINVNERVREIATLKVLGFNDKEVNVYVYRETLILTFLGIIVGLIFGSILHKFIVILAEPNNMVFLKNINIASYIFSTFATIMFLYIVRLFTHFILKKIDMIESLKSAE